MKDNYDFKILIAKYHRGECPEEEKAVVESWLLAALQNDLPTPTVQEIEAADDRMREVIAMHTGVKGSTGVGLWPRIVAVAAAAVAVIVSGVYFFNYNNNKTKEAQTYAYINDVAPGKVGATLTLANGKKISLKDARNGELANEAGISINKTADGEVVYEIKGNSGASKINTLSTAKGETYILTLPDKSKVWMNAASSLTYSTSLNEHGQRRVKLNGEAYFEISKDKSHPFVVETKGQEVEVLGTHFNVNAYDNEPAIKTTLLEGSVRVSQHTTGTGIPPEKVVVLKPGQQAEFSAKGIQVNQTDTEMAIAWKNNEFSFESEDIQTVMRMVERWYNVEVVYDGEITGEKFGGGVSRFDRVSKVLKSLASTGKVHFKIEGRRIYVSR